jgi:hypothetical protein
LKTRKLFALFTSFTLLLSVPAATVSADSSVDAGTQALQQMKRIGTTHLAGLHSAAAAPVAAAAPLAAAAPSTTSADSALLAGELRPEPDEASGGDAQFHDDPGPAPVPSTQAPKPPLQRIVDATGTPHYAGISHFDQRVAGSDKFANTQGSLEPPDQGLCVGNGFVVETVNTVIRVRNTAGALQADDMPLNQFFGLHPEIIRNAPPVPPVFGEFTSDPKCYFDSAAGGRWFVSLLELDIDPATGDFTGGSHLLLAVSTGRNPTGDFNLFSLDTTNDGRGDTPKHHNCPCFGDQPLIGADAYGFYVSTNEFPTLVAGFNGAIVYAFSKKALTAGSDGTVVSFFQKTLAEGQAYTLQPTTTPPGAAYASENGGSEYFLSTLEFTGGLDNRIALWSMTNTSSLASAHPKLKMAVKVLTTEVYGMPPVMNQRDGRTPLRDLLKSKYAMAYLGVEPVREKLPLLNSNGDAMAQTIYLNGRVWGSLSTVITSGSGGPRVGVAWFAVTPSTGKKLDGAVTTQGYVAVDRNHLAFPAIAANAGGRILVSFSLLGPGYFPSTAYSWLDTAAGTGDVRIVSRGVGPADGFTGYPSLDPGDNGVERWGDYSAATADAAGNLWFATEAINQSCTFSEFLNDTNCGGERTILANWGTVVAKVHP